MKTKSTGYRIFSSAVIILLAILFTFPLYWIITGSFKPAKEINAKNPTWWPQTWTLKNYQTLMSKQKLRCGRSKYLFPVISMKTGTLQ